MQLDCAGRRFCCSGQTAMEAGFSAAHRCGRRGTRTLARYRVGIGAVPNGNEAAGNARRVASFLRALAFQAAMADPASVQPGRLHTP